MDVQIQPEGGTTGGSADLNRFDLLGLTFRANHLLDFDHKLHGFTKLETSVDKKSHRFDFYLDVVTLAGFDRLFVLTTAVAEKRQLYPGFVVVVLEFDGPFAPRWALRCEGYGKGESLA